MNAATASAETIYKLIDRNGQVTYSEAPPKSFDGQVIRMNLDPNANTATLSKPAAKGESGRAESENEKIIHRRIVSNADRLQAARDGV